MERPHSPNRRAKHRIVKNDLFKALVTAVLGYGMLVQCHSHALSQPFL